MWECLFYAFILMVAVIGSIVAGNIVTMWIMTRKVVITSFAKEYTKTVLDIMNEMTLEK